ncbi:uncharacterized protein [Anabrus simplex]|uniref:uncharacterized protein n=1 Tax=Anabrus simplex TaxID=316456 RepID=UPI0035A3D3DE
MVVLCTPPRLAVICMDLLCPLYMKLGRKYDLEDPNAKGPLDKAAGRVVEEMLLHAYCRGIRGKKSDSAGVWNYDWLVYFTPRIESAVVMWDQELLTFLSKKCKGVYSALVTRWKNFDPESFSSWLPKKLITLDFDGELFYRRRRGPALQNISTKPGPWLPEAAELFSALHVSRESRLIPGDLSGHDKMCLAELHLGTVHVTSADLVVLLRQLPQLRLLRHYQLVTALYLMHGEQWRQQESLPRYKLQNLDVDFSHVVRCRMSPEAVLPSNVLHMAVRLCPEARFIRVRYDCSTPHDVLAPLMDLKHLSEFSVVCVSSGERTLLDFSDIAPILEAHGEQSLVFLELKVIEFVDVHVILSWCPNLHSLVLSGCGYVTPPTCNNYRCEALALSRLRLLFYADGDDFSWDHALPQCFWPATLGAAYGSPMEGIFLESPRISKNTLSGILKNRKRGTRLFPNLQILSLCRYPELSVEELAALCGADIHVRDEEIPLQYVRASQCEKIGPRQEMYLKNLLAKNRFEDGIVVTTQ